MFTPIDYQATANWLRFHLDGFEPEILLILGSGLGFLAEELERVKYIPYSEVPRFKVSTAPGHKGRLAAGVLSGKRVLAMQGRLHVYEGNTPEEVAFPIRAANILGVKTMITTCACGGVNTDYKPGDLSVLTDIINFTHTSPMVGFDISGFDTRFFDMSHVFDPVLISLAKNISKEKGMTLKESVYFYTVGPQYETPAEIRAIRTLGGDLVGMSTVHEVTMARRCGIKTLGIGLVSNMAAGVLDQPVTEEEVLVEAEKASKRFAELVTEIVKRI